jgi:hypothetical protein
VAVVALRQLARVQRAARMLMGSMSGSGVLTVMKSDGKILSRLPTDSDLASGGIDPNGD